MKKTQSKTDWNRVLAKKESDPIPYEPGDGPYDPNDVEATRGFFAQADLIRKGKVVRRVCLAWPAKDPDQKACFSASLSRSHSPLQIHRPRLANAHRQHVAEIDQEASVGDQESRSPVFTHEFLDPGHLN